MGRIEEALAKARANALARDGEGTQSRPIGRVTSPPAADGPSEHRYGGKYVEVDYAALRAQGLLAPDSEQRQLEDEYRVVKRPLIKNAANSADRSPGVARGNLVMVASAVPGEGKTFTCVNLCLSIAREKDWSVVLVDGDASKPHLTRLIGAENELGLVDLLRDSNTSFDDLVMPTNVPSFSLLPAGQRGEHAAELFASERMEALCDRISADDPHRLVVFDSSPLLHTTDAPVLASQVGQIAVVVHAEKTPQQAVMAAVGRLDHAKAISLVLNQAAAGIVPPGYGYEYGYGYGYGYGDQNA